MAKVPFTKLGAKVNGSDCRCSYYNDDQEIFYEIKQYLPIEEKLDLVSNVINASVDNYGYYNPMRVKIFLVLEMVQAYTNLGFTPKMLENPFKLYDLLVSTGIFNEVISSISQDDWKDIQDSVWATIDSIYKYKNSVVGILESIGSDYENLNLDAQQIQATLADPNNMELLKNILQKLG